MGQGYWIDNRLFHSEPDGREPYSHLLMENIRPCGDGYEMEYEGTGQYYQPFGEYQGSRALHPRRGGS